MQARSELTNERILACAAALIRQEGLHACTHRALALEVGVSPGTITWHYKTLDALYAAVIARAVTRFDEQARQWFVQHGEGDRATQLTDFLFWTLGEPDRLLGEYALFVAAVSRPRLRTAAAAWLDTHAALLQERFALPRPLADTLVAFTDAWLLRSVIGAGPTQPDYASVKASFMALCHAGDNGS